MKLNAETRGGRLPVHHKIVANEAFIANPSGKRPEPNPRREIDHMLRSARFQGSVTRSKFRISF